MTGRCSKSPPTSLTTAANQLCTVGKSGEQSGVEALTANLLSDLISVMSSSYPRVTLPGSTLHCPALPVLSLTEILCTVHKPHVLFIGLETNLKQLIALNGALFCKILTPNYVIL